MGQHKLDLPSNTRNVERERFKELKRLRVPVPGLYRSGEESQQRHKVVWQALRDRRGAKNIKKSRENPVDQEKNNA